MQLQTEVSGSVENNKCQGHTLMQKVRGKKSAIEQRSLWKRKQQEPA